MSTSEQKYGVFLSYAHKDAEIYGEDIILRIKDAIEDSIKEVAGEHSLVFLDTVALHEGDQWHAKIIEKMHECLVFVCLLSENYKSSDYCSRERLWWNAKETHNGRLLKDTYPVYYVKLDEDLFSNKQPPSVQDLVSIQMDDKKPWFNKIGSKIQEAFIRERMEHLQKGVCNKFSSASAAQMSFCSVQPPLCKNFVGRVRELRELLAMCENGNYPVIHGEGGVGKSEFAVAYASGFADKYLGGRYLIHMEGIHDWDNAFFKMLQMEGMDKEGIVPVWKHLCIKEEKLNNVQEAHLEAVRTLMNIASNNKLLILLDNVDDERLLANGQIGHMFCGYPFADGIASNIHVIVTTRLDMHFSERGKFYSFPLNNLSDEDAFELLCLDGNGEYPFDKNPPNSADEEYQSACKMIRLLDNHAWSLEIESAFMANNYSNGYTFKRIVKELQDNFKIHESDNETWRNVGRAEALVMPTLKQISNMELGEQILELGAFASCFNADNIPLLILEEYWRKNWPGAICHYGEPFQYAINQLKKYHLLDTPPAKQKNEIYIINKNLAKIHRLTQAVLRNKALDKLENIGAFCKSCVLITQDFWIDILLSVPELFDWCAAYILNIECWKKIIIKEKLVSKCQWDIFNGSAWSELLCEHPQFADKCRWEKLSGQDWSILLQKQPRFSEKCPWGILSGDDWINLLEKQPSFSQKCSWNKLSGKNWSDLLCSQTHFADKCTWEILSGDDWSRLLRLQPQFSEKCSWEKLSGTNWSYLLSFQPQFSDKCPWELLFHGSDWGHLLIKQPQFADKCLWDKLDGDEWSHLLIFQPKFVNKCLWEKLTSNDWQRIFDNKQIPDCFPCDFPSVLDWSYLIEKRPNFSNICPWEQLDGDAWSQLLAHQPQFADKCPWEQLDGDAWSQLLSYQPQFADMCPWEKLDGDAWSQLLSYQPQFADKCPWEKLNSRDWGDLSFFQPQFLDRCPLEKLDIFDFENILNWNPQLIERVIWEKLNGHAWSFLICKYPQLANKCPWEQLDGKDWSDLIVAHPQFAAKCPWEQLSGDDWSRLLSYQPQFSDKCSWKKLSGKNWTDLLHKQPQFADNYSVQKLYVYEIKWLLSEQPQLANKFIFRKFSGKDWCDLLRDQPQFSDKCSWGKLSGANWSSLLCKQPQFSDKCAWWKLSGLDWSVLLSYQPQFSCKCSWRKLSGNNWFGLLVCQPHFASKCPWKKMPEYDFFRLLWYHPEFSNITNRIPRVDFSGSDWSELLQIEPQFSNKCQWEKLSGSNWSELLLVQPQFANQCPWDKLSGQNWRELLVNKEEYSNREARPQFAKYCLWEKLSGKDWSKILQKLPILEIHCSWEKLSGSDWSELLKYQPRFSTKCDWKKLSEDNWNELIKVQPDFLQYKQKSKYYIFLEILEMLLWLFLLVMAYKFAHFFD